MKKLIVVLMIALLPTLAFALDFQIGGTAMYKGLLEDITSGTADIGFDDFTFGGEARLNFGLLQGAAAVLYYPGEVNLFAGGADRHRCHAEPRHRPARRRHRAELLHPARAARSTGVPIGLNLKGAVDLQLGKHLRSAWSGTTTSPRFRTWAPTCSRPPSPGSA